MPGRRIQIDIDGEVLDMDWDKPTPPTKTDVRAWIQSRRDMTPSTPALPPNVPTSLQLPKPRSQVLPPKDTGFLGALGEGVSGLGHFAKNIVAGHPLNPDFYSRIKAQQEVAEGIYNPVLEGARETYGYGQSGDYLKAAGRAIATPVEALAGIPLTGMARDVGEGRYGHAAGQGLFAGALAYAGARGGKGALRGKAAAGLPDVPPVVPERVPTQLPLVEGFEQPGLPFRENLPESGAWHGPEISPYGVPDPNIQQPLGLLQPVIRQQQLGFTSKPTHAWTPGPEVGTMPKPKASGPVEAAAKSNIPELQKAAVQTSRFQQMRDRVKSSPVGRAAADVAKSGTSVIASSGEAGPKLAQLLSRTRLLGEHLGGSWTVRAKEATKGLTPDQIETYVESRDKGTMPSDPAVVAALEKRAQLDAEVVAATKASGAGYRTAEGTVIPFRERANYWPHIYDRKALKQPGVIDALIKEGWSPEDAQKAVDRSSKYGERLISAQHERQGNAPGFRRDLDADYMHLNDLGKRVAEARELGPRDLADPNSPVSQLIKGTAEPTRITEIVSEHLGRNIPESGAAEWGAVNQGIRKVTTAAHLSHFALSNMSQLASVPLRSNLGAYTKALKSTISNWKKTVGEAEGTGALQTIHQDLLREAGGESFVSKLYGLKKSETLNRSVAAVAGKGTARDLFTQLKKDPTNKRARGRLENLLLQPVDDVLKQTALSEEQLGIAGGRMSEITQGRAQAIDLPKAWTGHPLAELALIFKKYAFQQGRIINAAVKENPGRNIPLLIATYTAMGEGIGDVKAGVRGTVSGQGAGAAIGERGEGLDRIINNMAQAWAFGMLGDVIEASGKPGGIAEYAAGPVVSDLNKLTRNVKQAAQGKPEGITKQALGTVPFIGTGLSARVGGGKGGGSGRLPRLPRPKNLPSLPRP
jgi:hypothetical protein